MPKRSGAESGGEAEAHIEAVQGTPQLAPRVAPETVRRTLLPEKRVQADRRNEPWRGLNEEAENAPHANPARHNAGAD